MDVEQESLDLIEPSQRESDTKMSEESEEIAFDDEKSNTEELQNEENIQESLDLIEPSQVTEQNDTKSKNSTAEAEEKPAEAEEKLFKFPLGTVKRIIKMDPDVNLLSKDSIFLITKSLEMFIESLSIEAYSYTAGAKKKTMSKQDVEKAIDAVDALAFLDGALDD